MEITLKVKKIGESKGTVGWIAENAHHVEYGPAQDGSPGLWLVGKDGKPMATLASCNAGYWLPFRCLYQYGSGFTDAAASVLSELSDDLILMVKAQEDQVASSLKVTVEGL